MLVRPRSGLRKSRLTLIDSNAPRKAARGARSERLVDAERRAVSLPRIRRGRDGRDPYGTYGAGFLFLASILARSRVLCAADAAPGLEHLRAGRVDEALEHFQAARRSNPDDLVALNMIGAILCIKDEPGDAIPYFERALQIAPDFVPARKNVAIGEFELGRYESAKAHLRELLDVPDARAQASLFLAHV